MLATNHDESLKYLNQYGSFVLFFFLSGMAVGRICPKIRAHLFVLMILKLISKIYLQVFESMEMTKLEILSISAFNLCRSCTGSEFWDLVFDSVLTFSFLCGSYLTKCIETTQL